MGALNGQIWTDGTGNFWVAVADDTIQTLTKSSDLSSALANYATKASPALTGNVTITTNSTSPALFVTQTGTGNILTLHDQASDTTFVAIDQNGKVNTIASTTAGAGFRITPGTAPTTPINGDVWITTGTAGVISYRTATTTQTIPTRELPNTFTNTNTFSGTFTASGTTASLGTATTASNVNVGTGAIASGTKTVNIGTAGTTGSTTNINIGTTGGGTSTANVNALLISRASTTTQAGLRVLHGTAPTSPVNGDIWTTTAGAFARINGATRSLAAPDFATPAQARAFSSTTTAMSPRQALWSMLTQDVWDIDGLDLVVTNVGTIALNQFGMVSRVTVLGTVGACSSRCRNFGVSQVDQSYNFTSRAHPRFSVLNFSLRSIHSGRTAIEGITDANTIAAFYYGKLDSDGVGDLTRRGFGWKFVGGAGSRFLQLQAHNGTTLASVTSSFAVTSNVGFDWDLESDGAGNVTLYVNGTSVATSNNGPTGVMSPTGVFWQEEAQALAASTGMGFYNSKGKFAVLNY